MIIDNPYQDSSCVLSLSIEIVTLLSYDTRLVDQRWAKYSKYSYSSTILVVLVLVLVLEGLVLVLVLVLEGLVLVHVLEHLSFQRMISASETLVLVLVLEGRYSYSYSRVGTRTRTRTRKSPYLPTSVVDKRSVLLFQNKTI
jgi:hypothetical protein